MYDSVDIRFALIVAQCDCPGISIEDNIRDIQALEKELSHAVEFGKFFQKRKQSYSVLLKLLRWKAFYMRTRCAGVNLSL